MEPPVPIDEAEIHNRCTEAVFERGEDYHDDGRITHLDRVGEQVTATVRGSRTYDVTIDLDPTDLDTQCTCPYDGPGDCKHIVAVLLECVSDPPADTGDTIDEALDRVDSDALEEFVREELARNSEVRERFLARFDGQAEKSVTDYRKEVDQLFDEHIDEYPVVLEAIDFSRYFDLAEQHREQGHYREAAKIYRALAVGVDENMELVDAAYDHYAQAFQSALDGYVECVSKATLDTQERDSYEEFLKERANTGTDYLREHYERALDRLRD